MKSAVSVKLVKARAWVLDRVWLPIRGVLPSRYQPRRRAPRARERLLYGVPGIGLAAILSAALLFVIIVFVSASKG